MLAKKSQRVALSSWTRRTIVCAIAAIIVSVTLSERAKATDGGLDSSFGGGSGTVITDFNNDGEAYAIAIQPDGRIVVAGLTRPDSDTSHNKAALARYNSDGRLDSSFGNGGKVIASTNTTEGFAVAIQPDGKILTSGFGSANVTRFNSDGSLDTGFGSGGVTGFLVNPYTMMLQPDGKILVGGYLIISYHTTAFAVGRYNSDGTVDTSFGSEGKVTTGFYGGHDQIHALALQPDGKIVAAGQATWGGENWFAVLARYDANGNLDTSFGNSGKVTTDFSPGHGMRYHRLYAVAVQPDGKILAAGATRNYDDSDSFALARYNINGSPDATFGNNGQVTTKIFGNAAAASALALQPGGRFFVAGSSNGSFALAHYNYNGSLDTSFGSNHNGQVVTQIGGFGESATAMALQRDGKVVVAGSSQYSSPSCCNYNFALARYLAKRSNTISDFNGIGKSNPAIYRGSDGSWLMLNPANGSTSSKQWGMSTDIIVPGDYDGDGKTDVAVFRPSEGNWYIINSSNSTAALQNWGADGDRPVPGDYDGDGKTDVAVFRPGEGNWYIRYSSNGTTRVQGWGTTGDKPVPGDYDNDGKTDLAVWRPSEGNWYIIQSSTNTLTLYNWGAVGDQPVPADYDGDGRTDIAVFRPAQGNWYVVNSATNTASVRGWGTSTDVPVPGDYDGDGKTDIAVFRPGENTWYLIRSSDETGALFFLGQSGDMPVPSAYLPQ